MVAVAAALGGKLTRPISKKGGHCNRRADPCELDSVIRRLVLAISSLLLVSSLTATSAFAEAACVIDYEAIVPHGRCADSQMARQCVKACPMMCAALAQRRTTIDAPALSPIVRTLLLTVALIGLDQRPDIPPPRSA